jgi:hypothetical protein
MPRGAWLDALSNPDAYLWAMMDDKLLDDVIAARWGMGND